MAEIIWVGNSGSTSFHSAGNWQGGIVPGIQDTAVFDDTGTGHCTLEEEITVGGIKLLTTYTGTFNANGKTLNIGNNGTGHMWLLQSSPSWSNCTINCYCHDVLIASTMLNAKVFYNTSCEYRHAGLGNWYVTTIRSGVTFTYRSSQHPQWNLSVRSQWNSNGGSTTIEAGAVFDVSECSAMLTRRSSGLPQFLCYGTLKSTNSDIIPFTAERSAALVIADIIGRFSVTWPLNFGATSGNDAIMGGHLHLLESLSIDVDVPSANRLLIFQENLTLPDTNILIMDSGGTLAVTTQSEVQCHGNFTVSGDSGCVTTSNVSIVLVGSLDQTVDTSALPDVAVMTLDKPDGQTLISGGDINFCGTSGGKVICNGSGTSLLNGNLVSCGLVVPRTFQGTFSTNSHKVTVTGDVLQLFKINATSITLSGDIDFSGSEFAISDVTIPAEATTNLLIRTSCEWWFSIASAPRHFTSITQLPGTTMTVRSGWHPDGRKSLISPFMLNAVTQDWHGNLVFQTLDSARNSLQGEVTFHENCVIDASEKPVIWQTSNTDTTVKIGQNATFFGDVDLLLTNASSQLTLFPGDYRQVKIRLAGTSNSARLILPDGEHLIGKTELTRGTFVQSANNTLKIFDHLTAQNANIKLPNRIVLAGNMSKQNVAVSGAGNLPMFAFEKSFGDCVIDVPVCLFKDSVIGNFSTEHYPMGFDLNDCRLEIVNQYCHLLDVDSEMFDFSGTLEVGCPDLVLRDTDLPADAVISITGMTEMRLLSQNETSQIGSLQITESGCCCLTDTPYSEMSGTCLTELAVNGDLTNNGLLKCTSSGEFRIIHLSESGTCQLGKVNAENGSCLAIDPGSCRFLPTDLAVEGDVSLRWGSPEGKVVLASGDYTPFLEIRITPNVEEIRLESGIFRFLQVFVVTAPETTTLWKCDGTGSVYCMGHILISGDGSCSSAMEQLIFEYLETSRPFDFTQNEMKIVHPVILADACVSGVGTLDTVASLPYHIESDCPFDVGTFRFSDGDGSVAVPSYPFTVILCDEKRFLTYG